jgi:hypothetical protein
VRPLPLLLIAKQQPLLVQLWEVAARPVVAAVVVAAVVVAAVVAAIINMKV